MENPKLVKAVANVTYEELMAAERWADAQLTISYLRWASDPTKEKDKAWDDANEDHKLISNALEIVKRGAKTCAEH